MRNNLIINIIRFLVLVPVQVLILNNINFGGYINPYLYVYFILLLPFEIPGWLLLISAFIMGYGIDLFSHTPGLHTAATVLMAFFRPVVIRSVGSRKDYESGMQPSISDLGLVWFLTYSIILIFIHHLAFFYLEVFRFSNFFDTAERVIFSTLFSLIFVIITQYLFGGKPK
jgi:rod shape-determining protein MreD